jgi:hypothetical protein
MGRGKPQSSHTARADGACFGQRHADVISILAGPTLPGAGQVTFNRPRSWASWPAWS